MQRKREFEHFCAHCFQIAFRFGQHFIGLEAAAAELESLVIGLRSGGRGVEADIVETGILIAGDPVLNARLERLPLVTLYLTERCNSRCVTCDYWRHGSVDMSLALVSSLLRAAVLRGAAR